MPPITFKQIATDTLDFAFGSFTTYRNLSADTWSLIETTSCPRPFWLRGIPKPCDCFRLIAVQHASHILSTVQTHA